MLEWYEADASQNIIKSPLILIPVLIERTRGDRFQIKYEGTGHIHADEVKADIVEAVKKSFGILRQDAVSVVLELLGFERITDLMFQQTDKLVHELVNVGKIIQQGEMLKPS